VNAQTLTLGWSQFSDDAEAVFFDDTADAWFGASLKLT
jgi:hypothetical protein